MSKNNYNQKNNKKGFIFIGLIAVFVLFIAWALFRTGNAPAGGSETANAGDLNSLVGKPLPALQLFDNNGKPYSLDSLKGKNVVLFFSEGIMCYPACWNQIASFGTDARFNSTSTIALSVVADNPSDWQQAIAKMPDLAKATLLFDHNTDASRSLGLLTLPSSMHKGMLPGHTYIVLDKQGIVRFVFDDPNMALNNDMLNQKVASLND